MGVDSHGEQAGIIETTQTSSYATFFFADYEDSSRRMRYVNCGHLPPLLLRASKGSQGRDSGKFEVDRLKATCTVLGQFEDWHCDVAEVQLSPGDTLVLYTDGAAPRKQPAPTVRSLARPACLRP